MEDDDAPRAAPKAGRRAGRRNDTWGDDSAGPPEPQKGGFGLDAAGAFDGGASSPPPPPRQMSGFGEMGGDTSSSRVGGSVDDGPPAPRNRGGDTGDRPPTQPRNAPSAKGMDVLGGEDSKKFIGVSRRKQEQLARDDDVSRRNLKYEQMEQRDASQRELRAGADGIMEIPELEEEGREDLSNVVAEAPKVRTNKVQGMDELEEEAHYRLPAMDDRDIDLSLLTSVLCSSEQVNEPEEVWDPDIVLTEVASAINSEREKAEGGDQPVEPELPLDEMK